MPPAVQEPFVQAIITQAIAGGAWLLITGLTLAGALVALTRKP